ncbi:type II toxin-antitoxin system RelE/ParE family toxin [Lacipirellula parvula]|uniref:Toxin n=1 Tax=Lacipirellula parvula TaxID=2650471 RepID=A0A5K7XEQ8_9BACT|nr:type II toxin-antitoxin system RelE/ParE family toxin [Lacipirellula parvula]BBO35364.1 hypothetical protein PLANPX_4976 [Lacipirellula parvula]
MNRLAVYRSSAADQDLVEIWVYVARSSTKAADQILRQIDARIEGLRSQPEIGERVEASRAGLRRIIEGHYLIFYQLVDDGIRIVRILHSARRWEELL